ncbi:hypothetical protein B0H13DRAFT_1855260 [Mycena leptocephala]|nr:hypothetical protein B0H13DRAFT_1855260 [Mycena leptocephala]
METKSAQYFLTTRLKPGVTFTIPVFQELDYTYILPQFYPVLSLGQPHPWHHTPATVPGSADEMADNNVADDIVNSPPPSPPANTITEHYSREGTILSTVSVHNKAALSVISVSSGSLASSSGSDTDEELNLLYPEPDSGLIDLSCPVRLVVWVNVGHMAKTPGPDADYAPAQIHNPPSGITMRSSPQRDGGALLGAQ